jgi:hypothetical protein
MFDIHLTNELVAETEPGIKAIYGKIYLGDSYETFTASLASWSPGDYERHWEAALRRIASGAGQSALITSYVGSSLEDFLIWWPLYRERDTIYIQNQMLSLDQLSNPFSTERPWESLRERQTTNSEGLQISEWATSIQSIQECLEAMQSKRETKK